MKEYSFYHLETGLLAPHVIGCPDEALELNTPEGHAAIEGHHDHMSKRVDIASGQVVDYQPSAPSADHEWNAETKRWQLSAAATDLANRRIAAISRIAQLENSQHRALREFALGMAGAADRLKEIDQTISALRKDLADALRRLPA